MPGDAGRQHPVEVLDGVAGEVHRGLLGSQQRLFMLLGALQALREAVQPPGDHQGGNVIQEQIVKALAPALVAQALEIGHLRLADDLQAAGVKIVVKVMELEAGTVHVRDGQLGGFKVAALVEYLQIE